MSTPPYTIRTWFVRQSGEQGSIDQPLNVISTEDPTSKTGLRKIAAQLPEKFESWAEEEDLRSDAFVAFQVFQGSAPTSPQIVIDPRAVITPRSDMRANFAHYCEPASQSRFLEFLRTWDGPNVIVLNRAHFVAGSVNCVHAHDHFHAA